MLARSPTSLPPPARTQLQARLEEAHRRIKTLEGKAALVGTECVKLRAENEALRRNASSLYRTAKRELGRKDAEIAGLREQVRAVQQQQQHHHHQHNQRPR